VEVRAGGRAIRTEVAPDGTIVQRVAPVVTGERETIRIDGRPVTFVPVDVGNPHAVVPSDAVTGDELRRIGPALERHPRFPGRTNVQLAQAAGRSAVDARVWERGVGETPSSGSSAVAVAAAAARLGWCDDRVTVRFPGGDLLVELDGSGASLTGPAVEICRGELAAR
jgi:diaminopimelate epimerase